MNNKDKYYVIFIIVVLFIVAYLVFPNFFGSNVPSVIQENQNAQTEKLSVSIKGQTFYVGIAESTSELTRGLSGRESLAEDEGLLFVFPNIAKESFWMKDMNFPIDIIWLDENYKIVHIKENALPEDYPETYTPSSPAKYVLEINTGIVAEAGIQLGDVMLIENSE